MRSTNPRRESEVEVKDSGITTQRAAAVIYGAAQGSATAAEGVCSAGQASDTAAEGICSAGQGSATMAEGICSAAQGSATVAEGICSAGQGSATGGGLSASVTFSLRVHLLVPWIRAPGSLNVLDHISGDQKTHARLRSCAGVREALLALGGTGDRVGCVACRCSDTMTALACCQIW